MIPYFIPMISYLTQNDIAFYPNEIVFYPGDPNSIEFYTDEIVFYPGVIVFYPNDVFNHNVLFFLNQYNIDFFFYILYPKW